MKDEYIIEENLINLSFRDGRLALGDELVNISGKRFHLIFITNRVAKCQIFYTEQIFQTKFYPKKSAKTATNLATGMNEIITKGYYQGTKAEYSII